jgi:uncharacterized repeat protein (TIGR03803 family)
MRLKFRVGTMFALRVAAILFLFGGLASPARAQTYRDRHDFGGTVINADGVSGPDGFQPLAGITFDLAGNKYGTTFEGGANGLGTVWEITASGTYKDLHDFGGIVINADGASGRDGLSPFAAVTFDSAGNI